MVKKWYYENCKEEALKYNNRSELSKYKRKVYDKIRKNKWDELLEHMTPLQKPKGYWTYEKCKEEALKYNNRKDLSKNNGTVLNIIRENKWDELLEHMEYECKPKGYWNYERCKEEALKYTKRLDLIKNNSSILNVIHRNKWDELLEHMEYECKPNGYWTYDRCEKLISKYDNWKSFINENISAYNSICRNKWQDKLGSHMEYSIKPNGYWTYVRCKEAALKYTTIKDIRESKDTIAYTVIKKNEWIELIEHFIEIRKPNGYWTYDRCKEEALKYNIRSDFAKKSNTSYSVINKNKWYELLNHMDFQDNIKKRYIYVFEFTDNNAYIGLSWNPTKRKLDHLSNKKSPVIRHITQNNVEYEWKVITEALTEKEAQIQESIKIQEYKDKGWVMLNTAKAGGLGSMRVKWTKRCIMKIANTCTTITELYTKIPPQAISIARKNGYFNEILNKLHLDKKPPGYWNDKENCRKAALKYKNRADFQKFDSAAFKSSYKNGWLDEFIDTNYNQKMKKWNDKEKCHKKALEFNTIKAFKVKAIYPYKVAFNNGWLDEITSHMDKPKYTFEQCKEVALKYNCRHHLEKGCYSIYRFSLKNKWLDIFYPV